VFIAVRIRSASYLAVRHCPLAAIRIRPALDLTVNLRAIFRSAVEVRRRSVAAVARCHLEPPAIPVACAAIRIQCARLGTVDRPAIGSCFFAAADIQTAGIQRRHPFALAYASWPFDTVTTGTVFHSRTIHTDPVATLAAHRPCAVTVFNIHQRGARDTNITTALNVFPLRPARECSTVTRPYTAGGPRPPDEPGIVFGTINVPVDIIVHHVMAIHERPVVVRCHPVT
jgi:hypothetical protein